MRNLKIFQTELEDDWKILSRFQTISFLLVIKVSEQVTKSWKINKAVGRRHYKPDLYL